MRQSYKIISLYRSLHCASPTKVTLHSFLQQDISRNFFLSLDNEVLIVFAKLKELINFLLFP